MVRDFETYKKLGDTRSGLCMAISYIEALNGIPINEKIAIIGKLKMKGSIL